MWGAEEFESRLLEAVTQYDLADSRFLKMLRQGHCPPAMLQRYARAICASAELFCATLVEMADGAPNYKARYLLLRNAMEEEGVFLTPRKGLVVRPEKKHLAYARRFARTCGVEDDAPGDAERASAPGRELLAADRWVEAVAYILVGQELAFGTAAGQLYNAFREFGLDSEDLVFFAVHSEADMRHGQEAIALVVENTDTPQLQRAAVQAAADGARRWFELHDGRPRQSSTVDAA